MRFGPVPLDAARGAVLAHSLRAGETRLKKGRVLDAADLAALEAAGIAEVTVARPDPGDVGEDAAADRLARALAAPGEGGQEAQGSGLRFSAAATGRVNLFATGPCLARIDAAVIDRVNRVDPMITVATLPEWQRCAEGTMIATVKIISYAVPGTALDAACAAASGGIGTAPPVLRRASLVETETAGAPTSDKGARAVEARLDRLGVAMDGPNRVAHSIAPLAEAIAAAEGAVILVLTGSATSDLHDVAPEALRAAGGEVVHFGMPVDPGNLLFIGTLGERVVIGLPGCARSPALNGADWVLERVICGVPVGPDEISAMGVGGLLKEIPTRPRPRDH